MKNNGYYKWSLTKLVASAMFALAPSLVALNRSYAKTLDVNPSMTVTEINNVISSSDPNDTINFTTGTYTVPLEWPPVYFSLKPDRNYTFDEKGVIVDGTDLDNLLLMAIQEGGNININGNLKFLNAEQGISIGGIPYDNINIGDLKSVIEFNNLKNWGIAITNVKDPEAKEPRTEAAVKVMGCVFKETPGSQRQGIRFSHQGQEIDEFSPYASAENCTGTGLVKFMDVPLAVINDVITPLGNDEVKSNSLVDCASLTSTSVYQFFASPTDIAQLNVASPLVTGVDYGAGPYDGENCFVADPNDFLSDRLTPSRKGSLIQRDLDGRMTGYIGAIAPVDLPGDIYTDGKVDMKDLTLAGKYFAGDLTEIVNIANDWLAREE